MSKILAIFGATGQQGGGLIRQILADPQLSAQYTIRAITRDATSPKAMQLKEKGVSVVPGDISSPSSLEAALTGAHTVFIMTPPSFGPSGFQDEFNHAKTIADVAVAAGASYLIFSTLPSVREISTGKYTKVAAFDAKAEAEKYIRSLPIKSAFYCPGSFMENLLYPIAIIRRQKPDGTWIWSQQVSGDTKLPLIAATEDTGKFVGAILAEPDKYVGSRFCAAAEIYTWDEIVGIVSRVTGKKVVYEPVSVEEYAKILPPPAADVFVEGFLYYQDFGYFGPDMAELVQWAKENARGRLTTFEEWLRAHPLNFE